MPSRVRPHSLAATNVARVDRHEQLGITHDRTGREADAAAPDHHACPVSSSPFDQPVGVSQKNPLEQIVVRLEVALRLTFAMPATAA